MASIPFVKVEGCGNDFIVVDLRPGQPGADLRPSPADPEMARALCDRHFGIGADGVLAIAAGDQGDARMRVINADGSEAEMCGNGIRCVSKVLYEKADGVKRRVLRIDTGAGLLNCSLNLSDGRVRSVAVDMGRPRLRRADIPMTGPPDEHAVRSTIETTAAHGNRRAFTFTAVSMGNPHLVIFVDDPIADLRALAETYGPGLERHPFFPQRTNVEFARVRTQAGADVDKVTIDLVVWERGCGITMACGTGACATVVAACLEGRAHAEHEIQVNLPGGPLFITARQEPEIAHFGSGTPIGAAYSGVVMRGPAEVVFEAELDLSYFASRLGEKNQPRS